MATNGNHGRFSERIKKIAFRKKNRNTYVDTENSKLGYINILKVLAAIPDMVYSNISSDFNPDNKEISGNISIDKKNKDNLAKIYSIDVNNIKKKQASFYKDYKFKSLNENVHDVDFKKYQKVELDDIGKVSIKENIVDDNVEKDVSNTSVVWNTNEIKVKKLEKDIIDIIKKKLVLSINNLEILQSELYILSEVNGEEKSVVECQKQIMEIKLLLKHIKKLKEQYDFLRDNYDFEYLMAIDDDNLIDKIVLLKDMFGNNQVRVLVEDYKLLDEYKYLYLKIDKLQDKTYGFEKKKQKQLEELKFRDSDFEIFKNKVYNVERTSDLYNKFVNEQNEIISEIDKNILKINSYEQVDYHLKGFNKLFLNSFKYFGLLMLSPLKGVFPSIAAEALITRDIVKNLYNNVKWEEEKRIVYETQDFSFEINNAISVMENIDNVIDMSLNDIVQLKMEYSRRFKEYHGDFSEYRNIIQKIDDMENKIMGNKIKVEIMKKRALEQKKENNKKLTLVDKLNNNE